MNPDDPDLAVMIRRLEARGDAAPGIESLRFAVSDANPDEAARRDARAWVRESARTPDAAPPMGRASVPLDAALRAHKAGYSRCWFSYMEHPCGCSGVRCHLLGRVVTIRDCVKCLGLNQEETVSHARP